MTPSPIFRKANSGSCAARTCGMIYANPVPAQFASGQHYDGLGAEYYLSPAKLESDYAAGAVRARATALPKALPGGAVLDVGCSSGAFLYQLRPALPGLLRGARHGRERCAAGVCGVARGPCRARAISCEQPFAGRKFDAVTFWAVLEHLLEPRAVPGKGPRPS